MTDKLYRADVAEMLGVKINSLARLGLPERDGTDVERGKARPFWQPEVKFRSGSQNDLAVASELTGPPPTSSPSSLSK